MKRVFRQTRMFKLRQKTRRRLCRAGFLLGCLLPTISLALWGAYRHSPVHARRHELALRQSLGLRARVAAVAGPRPGVVRYRDLELADAETGRPMAMCGLVEVRRPAIGGPTELLVQDVTIRPGGLAACYALVSRLLRSDQGEDDLDLLLTVERITISDPGEPYFLSRASGSIRSSSSDGEAKLSLASGDAADAAAEGSETNADKILLRVARNRQKPTPTDEWELHTGSRAVPCSWFSAIADHLPYVPGSQFRGSVWARQSESVWQVAVRGTVANVDLAQVVTKSFDHALEGTVDLHVDAAHFEAGRLIDLRARIEGGPGRISHSLLAAATAALGCAPAYQPQTHGGILPYQQLALKVEIHRDGKLAIAGRCPDKLGVMLTNGDGRPLLSQPRPQPQSVLNLVRALAGADGPFVPATPQAALLLGWLPLPVASVSEPATATRAPPSAAARPGEDTLR
jgi:hypothetical protein